MKTFSQAGDSYDCFVDQMFRHARAVQGHPFLARRDPDPKIRGYQDLTMFVDGMTAEADLTMMPFWHLLKYNSKVLEDENGIKSRYDVEVSQSDEAKPWQQYEAGLIFAGE
jgi:hypothetical protein